MKRIIRLTERELRSIIRECIFEEVLKGADDYSGPVMPKSINSTGKSPYDNDLGIFYNSDQNALRNPDKVNNTVNGNHSNMDKVRFPSPTDNTGYSFASNIQYMPINDNRYKKYCLTHFGKWRSNSGGLFNTEDDLFTTDPKMKGTQYNFRTAFDVLMGNSYEHDSTYYNREMQQWIKTNQNTAINDWLCVYPESQKSRKGILFYNFKGQWYLFKPDNLLNPKPVDLPKSDERFMREDPDGYKEASSDDERLDSVADGNRTTFKKRKKTRVNAIPDWVRSLDSSSQRALCAFARKNGWEKVPEEAKDWSPKEIRKFIKFGGNL